MPAEKKHFFDRLTTLIGGVAGLIVAITGLVAAWSHWGSGGEAAATSNQALPDRPSATTQVATVNEPAPIFDVRTAPSAKAIDGPAPGPTAAVDRQPPSAPPPATPQPNPIATQPAGPGPIASTLDYAGAGTIVANNQSVPFRSGPSLEYGEVARLRPRARVSLGPKHGVWWPVRTEDGLTGYVHEAYVQADAPR